MQLERVSCPLCGGDRSEPAATRADGLCIVRCARCRLAHVNPRPGRDDIARLYGGGYFEDGSETGVGYAGYARAPGLVRTVPPFDWGLLEQRGALAGLRVLDVGCAFGALVHWMQRAGARATGVDLASGAVAWGREQLGLDLRPGGVEAVRAEAGTFDLITMADVIEHVPDLSGFLGELRALLRPGGRVYVRTPNFACYPRYGDQCSFLHSSLEHLLYFEAATLQAAFAANGFAPEGPPTVLSFQPPTLAAARDRIEARPAGWRRLARALPVADLLRRARALAAPVAYRYRVDESGQDGELLVAFFRRGD